MNIIHSLVVLILITVNYAAASPPSMVQPVSAATQKEVIIQRITTQCCQMGRGSTHPECRGYRKNPQYDEAWNNFCKMEYEKCCTAERAIKSCERGRGAALAGIECSTMISDPLRIWEMHCCEACRAGISNGHHVSDFSECEWRAQTNRLEDVSVKECCIQTAKKIKSQPVAVTPQAPVAETPAKRDSSSDGPAAGIKCSDCEHSCASSGTTDHTCVCRDGFTLGVDGKSCLDVDECKSTPPVCNGTSICVNKEGSFDCQEKDLLASGSEEVTKVADVAVSTPSPDVSGQLENDQRQEPAVTPKPVCDTGYEYAEEEQECVDIDECQTNAHDCGPSDKCVNVDGSFSCQSTDCAKGHEYDYETERCVDIDECGVAEARNETLCEDHQTCINLEGSFKCEQKCPPGHKLNSGWVFSGCIDIDECADGSHNCTDPHVCKNIDGSYECVCKPGMEPDPIDQRCVDINECKQEPSPCDSDRSCHNTLGSFECRCVPGYEEMNGSCVDIDECSETVSPCPLNSRCINTRGHFECNCPDKFKIDDNSTACISTIPCRGLENNWECYCPKGFKLIHDQSCVDDNECDQENRCRRNEMCLNLFGGYKCVPVECPEGYIDTNGTALGHPKCVIDGYIRCLADDMDACRKLGDSEMESLSIEYHVLALQPGNVTDTPPIYQTKNLGTALEIKFSTKPKELADNFGYNKERDAVHLLKGLEPSSNVNMTISLMSKRTGKPIHRSIVIMFVSDENENEFQKRIEMERSRGESS